MAASIRRPDSLGSTPSSPRTASARARPAVGGLLFAMLLAGAAMPAYAIAPSVRSSSYLEVFVNQRPTRKVVEFHLRPGGDLAATRADLRDIGLDPPGRGRDDELIPISRIPQLSVSVDQRLQRIDISARYDVLRPTMIDASGRDAEAPPPRPESDTGAVVNYRLFGSGDVGQNGGGLRPSFSGASLTLDARVFSPVGVFEQTGILGKTVVSETEITRLDTSYTYTHPETGRTVRLGDSITSGPVWARAVRFGGVQVAQDYRSRPDIVTAPLPTLAGSAAAPSTVDVFVGGVKTFSRDVGAGPFAINNVPGLAGSGQATVVLRDVTGREVRTALPFFTSTKLLSQGLLESSGSFGFARYGYATPETTYGRTPIGTAAARYGLNDKVTVETYAEGGAGLAGLGAGASVNAFDRAIVSLAGRGSRLEGRNGFQGYVGVESRLGPISIAASSERSVGAFEDLVSATSRLERPGHVRSLEFYSSAGPLAYAPLVTSDARSAVDRVSVGTSGPLPGSSMGVSFVQQTDDQRGRVRAVSANYMQQVGPSLSLFASSFVDLSRERNMGVFGGVSMRLGDDRIGTTSISSQDGGLVGSIEAQKTLGVESGSVGLRARASRENGEQRLGGAAALLTDVGRGSVEIDGGRGGGSLRGEIEGSVVAMKSAIVPARRIEDSFALVKVGAPGVDVLHEGRTIGRTDRWGRFVVPSLFSNESNRIAVDPMKLPADVTVRQTATTVMPMPRSGVVVDLGGVSERASAMVLLLDRKGQPITPGAIGSLQGSSEPFTVGMDGRAYVRGLGPSNTVQVELPNGSCRATFPHRPDPSRPVEIGPVPCL